MKIYLATQPEPDINQGHTLTKVLNSHRLLSHIYIVGSITKGFDFKFYVEKGIVRFIK